MSQSTLAKIRQERLMKIRKLQELGIDPFPSKSKRNIKNQEVIAKFKELENKEVIVAGRLMSFREHGALAFGHILDQSGKLQLYFHLNDLHKTCKKRQLIGKEHLNLLDIGDFVEAKGIVTKTKRGEISILVKELKLLSKSIRPLPEKFKGLTNKEERLRRRYLDLIINDEVKKRFLRKAKFWDKSREFMKKHGFIEVETPVLEHVTGGADARPFVTHHNDLDQDFYLRISTELYQKRLIGGGFEKIYTLGPNFRNEGLSDEHLQEYYQLEWYWAYANYKDNMDLTKQLYRYLAKEVYGKTRFTTRGHTFDLSQKWEEIDYEKIMKEKLGIDIFKDSLEKMLAVLKKHDVNLSEGEINKNRVVDNLWKVIRKDISGPAFLVNIPKFISPLAKSKKDNPELTERFQIILAGSELGNGYSEINDPIDQLNRFVEQQELRESGDDEAHMLDLDFVEMLEYGMPPVTGFGFSERLFWFMEDVTAREGTLFPQLKFELDKHTKEIYKDVIKKLKIDSNKTAKKESDDPSLIKDYKLPTRKQTFKLLKRYVKDNYQILHATMVEEAMRAYAKKYNADEELWGIVGLLHDIDFYKWPDTHPNEEKIREITQNKYPDIVYEAIMGHWTKTGVERKTKMAKALIAIDELAGLFFAVAKARPTGFDMKLKSIKKKFKDKSFAAKIDRNEIKLGVEELGISLDEHFQFLIEVFKKFQSNL